MRYYVRIHIEDQKPIMVLTGIKKLLEHLPAEHFMRVHRSYVVHLNKITTIERNRIVFDEKVFIPISDLYKEQFHDFMNRHFLK